MMSLILAVVVQVLALYFAVAMGLILSEGTAGLGSGIPSGIAFVVTLSCAALFLAYQAGAQ